MAKLVPIVAFVVIASSPVGIHADPGDGFGSGQLDRDHLAQLVCSLPWPCGWAVETAVCESQGITTAYNPAGPYIGLFQVEGGSMDPTENVRQAFAMWAEWQRGERGNPWAYCGR